LGAHESPIASTGVDRYDNRLGGAFVFAPGQQYARRSSDGDPSTLSLNLFQRTPPGRACSDRIVGWIHCGAGVHAHAGPRCERADEGLKALRFDRVCS
jgi:hypothetical protein